MRLERRHAIAWCLVTGLLAFGPAHGAKVLDATLHRQGDTYQLDIRARIQAPEAAVRRIVTDYPHLSRLNPAIKSSKVLAVYGPGSSRVRTVTHACVLFFCKDIVQVQDVKVMPDGEVVATTVPALSDFKSAVARWRLSRVGDATVMDFSARFVPHFWVPPLIGPWLIRHKLTDEMAKTAERIEQIADRGADLDPSSGASSR